MASKKSDKRSTKVKKKRWVQIYAPKVLNELFLGETIVENPEKAVGKTMKVNLMNLLNDAKRQNVNVKFIVTKVQGTRAISEVIGYEMIPASIKRLIRKGKQRIDDSFICVTSDSKRIRIKPMLLSRSTTKGSVDKALRAHAKSVIIDTLKKTPYATVVSALLSHRLQDSLRGELRKIYPVRICEIRQMYIETERVAGKSKEASILEAVETMDLTDIEAAQEPEEEKPAAEEKAPAEKQAPKKAEEKQEEKKAEPKKEIPAKESAEEKPAKKKE